MKQALSQTTTASKAASSSPHSTGSKFSAILPVVKEVKQRGISKQSVLDCLKVGFKGLQYLCVGGLVLDSLVGQ
jgi:hypothetical protein